MKTIPNSTAICNAQNSIYFRNLTDIPLEDILNCFNACFREYFVPLQLTIPLLLQKIKTEAIELHLSIGAFEKDKLVGFILHGVDKIDEQLVAYNAGTGILPSHRAMGITAVMYDFAIALLHENQIDKSVLEVITENVYALQAYKRAGFIIKRKLVSFKLEKRPFNVSESTIEEWSLSQFDKLQYQREWLPAWQYSNNSVNRSGSDYRLHVICCASDPLAYCVSNIQMGRIAHFGCIDFLKYDFELKRLFTYVNQIAGKSLSIIHVDQNAGSSIAFLQSFGFTTFLSAYEMNRDI